MKKKPTPKKGDVILNREMTTQSGRLTAQKGHQLVSVFLGSVPDGQDPDPLRRMHSLGFRQMTMFELSLKIQDHAEKREWRLVYCCLGAVDAVEAAQRFANKMMTDAFNNAPPESPAPVLLSMAVGTIQVGPIGPDGTPHNGRGPAFFSWAHGHGVSLDDHIQALREEAKRHANQ